MIAVINGDIVDSRKLHEAEKWLTPLKQLLAKWGKSPRQWELIWGDSFQLEIEHPEKALYQAIAIKALIKKIGVIDVRMAVGIGKKTFSGKRVSESNGPAFVHAGERFETLKKEKINLALSSPWPHFDDEMNRYLRLAGIVMDNWSIPSAELMELVLNHPDATQKEIGRKLGIKQNSVSDRWGRAKVDEILDVEEAYRRKLKNLLVK